MCLGFGAVAASAVAAPGLIDLIFGGCGKLTTSFGPGTDTSGDSTIQADGKIDAAAIGDSTGTVGGRSQRDITIAPLLDSPISTGIGISVATAGPLAVVNPLDHKDPACLPGRVLYQEQVTVHVPREEPPMRAMGI